MKRLFGNTLIFTAGKFISKLMVFFMMPIYTACLSEAQYSTADLITQLANLLIPLACLGISDGIFRNAGGTKTLAKDSDDGAGRMEGFFTAPQDANISAFQRQGGGICGDAVVGHGIQQSGHWTQRQAAASGEGGGLAQCGGDRHQKAQGGA